MSQNKGGPKLNEIGLFAPDRCAVVMIDLQFQMLFGVSRVNRQTDINSNLIRSRVARKFDGSAVLGTVEFPAFSGNFSPQELAVFPQQKPIERSTKNSWDGQNVMHIGGNHCGAFEMGVENACAMVRHAPAGRFPAYAPQWAAAHK